MRERLVNGSTQPTDLADLALHPIRYKDIRRCCSHRNLELIFQRRSRGRSHIKVDVKTETYCNDGLHTSQHKPLDNKSGALKVMAEQDRGSDLDGQEIRSGKSGPAST